MTKIKLLKKLKTVSDVYLDLDNLDNGSQLELAEASEYIIKGLESAGVARAWSEAFLCYGDGFLMFEYGIGFDKLMKAAKK